MTRYIYEGTSPWSGAIVHWMIGSDHRYQEQSPQLLIVGRQSVTVQLHHSLKAEFLIAAVDTDASRQYVAFNLVREEE